MYYQSTRGKSVKRTGIQAVIAGIAEDGGLFVPMELPNFSGELADFAGLSYEETAFRVMSPFFPEIPVEKFKAAVANAYGGKFENPKIAPVVSVGDHFNFLELYHGPTLAFKDMALSFLPELMKLALEAEGKGEEILILTATSGDTGKAALEGFKNKEGIKILVFYPKDGVSEMQKRQMVTEDGGNAFVAAVDGNFDDAQSGVKNLFMDEDFCEAVKGEGYRFSSANSINIGRLVPQIAYYVYGYFQLVAQRKIALGELLNVAVPTGNFGNILAAYYAKQMGLPLGRLICASNENHVLSDFFGTGIYDRNRPLHLTTSPSMDILISSNLERLIYEISGRDSEKVASLMQNLQENGRYEIDEVMKENLQDFYGVYSTEEEIAVQIKEVFDATGYLMDTHTAVGAHAYSRYREESGDRNCAMLISTASPFKFSEAVAEALNFSAAGLDFYQVSELLAKEANLSVPKQLEKLKTAQVRFNQVYAKEDMKSAVMEFLGLQVKR